MPSSATDSAARTFCSTSSDGQARSSSQSCAQQCHDLRGDPGCEAERRLVQQQQSRPGDERAADREHLPLAAGQLLRRAPCGGPRAARTAGRPRRPRPRRRRGRVRHRPPRRRFSSTVSSAMTPPVSGTCAMPRAAPAPRRGPPRRDGRQVLAVEARPCRRSGGSARTASAAAWSCRRRWRRASRRSRRPARSGRCRAAPARRRSRRPARTLEHRLGDRLDLRARSRDLRAEVGLGDGGRALDLAPADPAR